MSIFKVKNKTISFILDDKHQIKVFKDNEDFLVFELYSAEGSFLIRKKYDKNEVYLNLI